MDPLSSVAAHEYSQGFLTHLSRRQKHRVPSAPHTVSFVSSLAGAFATALVKSWLAFFPDKARALGDEDKAEVSMMKEMIGLRLPKEWGCQHLQFSPILPCGPPCPEACECSVHLLLTWAHSGLQLPESPSPPTVCWPQCRVEPAGHVSVLTSDS